MPGLNTKALREKGPHPPPSLPGAAPSWSPPSPLTLQVPEDNSMYLTLYPKPIPCFCFLGPHLGHMEFPQGQIRQSCNCRPQPQQWGIQAKSENYTRAHGNTMSLTHWARPGIELVSSWIIVGLVSAETQQELPMAILFKQFKLFKKNSNESNKLTKSTTAVKINNYPLGSMKGQIRVCFLSAVPGEEIMCFIKWSLESLKKNCDLTCSNTICLSENNSFLRLFWLVVKKSALLWYYLIISFHTNLVLEPILIHTFNKRL